MRFPVACVSVCAHMHVCVYTVLCSSVMFFDTHIFKYWPAKFALSTMHQKATFRFNSINKKEGGQRLTQACCGNRKATSNRGAEWCRQILCKWFDQKVQYSPITYTISKCEKYLQGQTIHTFTNATYNIVQNTNKVLWSAYQIKTNLYKAKVQRRNVYLRSVWSVCMVLIVVACQDGD